MGNSRQFTDEELDEYYLEWLGEQSPQAIDDKEMRDIVREELEVVRSLPIRLTPMTATCRVPPLSRVKLGIGWSRGVARDAEQ